MTINLMRIQSLLRALDALVTIAPELRGGQRWQAVDVQSIVEFDTLRDNVNNALPCNVKKEKDCNGK